MVVNPSKHLGRVVGEVTDFWCREESLPRIAALYVILTKTAELDLDLAAGEKSPEQVSRTLQAWGASPTTAQLFVADRAA
jgi:hypothetical protein